MGFLDLPGITRAGLDTALAGKITDPASDTAGALNATFVLKSEAPPSTLDGGNATSTYNTPGTFNFDGGSAA